MKAKVLRERKTKIQESQESFDDCSCQLLDTSLSNVGESDCSCSECLEANLQAFNQLKEMEDKVRLENENRVTRGASTRMNSNKQTRGVSNGDRGQQGQNTQTKLNGFKSVDKMRETQPNQSRRTNIQIASNVGGDYGQQMQSKFSRDCINDYMKITQYRAREYLNQRKKLQRDEKEQRLKLKGMIKQNLQALKFAVQHKQEQQKQNQDNFDPRFKWSHQPYHCKSRVQCKKLVHYDPDLQNKKEEIQMIKNRIKQYEQKSKIDKYQCPDRCPNHHLRTSKKKLAEIQKFIQKKAKRYQENKKRQKAEKEQKEKIKAAKLRAIDIRCKDIVAKSKKYDPSISRTSFQNSIDHFSTFSELRINRDARMNLREKKAKVRKAIKQGGAIEEQLYQNLSDSLIGDHPPIYSKIGAQSRQNQNFEDQQSEEWCHKIVQDAKIKPPKEVKKEDASRKVAKKEEQRQTKQLQKDKNFKKPKKDNEKMLRKEQEKRRELQMQIERRKEEIFNQYQKRNSMNGSRKQQTENKKVKQQYEQSLKSHKSPQSHQTGSRKQESYDPYRQVYKNQPTKDPKQLKVVGDPLIHQYEYQKTVGRLKELQVDEDHEIFTKSGSNLKGKPYLNV